MLSTPHLSRRLPTISHQNHQPPSTRPALQPGPYRAAVGGFQAVEALRGGGAGLVAPRRQLSGGVRQRRDWRGWGRGSRGGGGGSMLCEP